MTVPLKYLAPAPIRVPEVDYYPALVNPLFVDAGPNQSLLDVLVATLAGTSSNSNLTYLWTLVSGPGTATFSDATVLNPTVTVSVVGSYVFRLTGVFSYWTASDDVGVAFAETPTIPARVLIAGAGGGGASGGGGGGEFIEVPIMILDLNATYPVSIGTGGTGAVVNLFGGVRGGNGGLTMFNGLSALGGGGGGTVLESGFPTGADGASGGGGGAAGSAQTYGGTGSPGSNGGGNGNRRANPYPSGGGGGAGGPGEDATSATKSGNGGIGVTSDIEDNILKGYCGGGGGEGFEGGTEGSGTDGGGTGGIPGGGHGVRGGGGGANGVGGQGGNGSNGRVVIRYAGTPVFTGGVITNVGGDTVHVFDSSGTLAPL